MKPSQDIRAITYLKTRTAELVDRTARTRRPVVITQKGRAAVVIQDVKSFERDRDALLMLKLLAQGMAEVDRGAGIDHEDLLQQIERRIVQHAKSHA